MCLGPSRTGALRGGSLPGGAGALVTPGAFQPAVRPTQTHTIQGQARPALGVTTRDHAMRHLCGDVLRAARACLLVGDARCTGATPNFAQFEASVAIVDRRPRLDLGQRGLDRTEHRGNHVAEPRPIELFTIHGGPHATRRQRDAEGNRRTARRYPVHPLPSGSPRFREHLSVLLPDVGERRPYARRYSTQLATDANTTLTQPTRRITGTQYKDAVPNRGSQQLAGGTDGERSMQQSRTRTLRNNANAN